MRLLKQLLVVFAVLVLLAGVLTIFSFDIIKIKWVSFMGLQPSFGYMEQPQPVPARSVPIEGPATIPNMGVPKNPVPADAVSIVRGAQLFGTHCIMCHGAKGEGNGQLAALLANRPANLTLPITQTKSDSALFLTITNGVAGRMPALNENLTVRERWDVINFLRTLAAPAP
jgi:mono/diheme cytochrome c family protein